jgi:hypothetical protein
MQLTYKEIVALECITNSYRNELCCSWSCWCRGKCSKWTYCEVVFCVAVWCSWHVSNSI